MNLSCTPQRTGTRRFRTVGLTVLCLMSLILIATAAQAATVTTDKADYAPGETVSITGAGFTNGENVTVQVTHLDGTPSGGEGHDSWETKAKGGGGFLTSWIIPDDDNVDETLLITATGQTSGLVATTTFTDVNTILTFETLPASIPAGTPITVSVKLEQGCPGPDAPLAGHLVLFFLKPGNCGVDVGQTPDATGITDVNGIAIPDSVLISLATDFTVRAKFLGEDKPPNPCLDPNSACDPSACVKLSASNVCQTIEILPSCNLTITCPSDVTIECDESTDPANTGMATASGTCPPITITYTDASAAGACAQEETLTRTWTATDDEGNTATCTQTITVEDTTPPVITGVGADFTIECPAALVFSDPSASDLCDPAPSLTDVFLDIVTPGACPAEFSVTRTWEATDACGNSVTASQTITVEDNTAPVIVSCAVNLAFQCASQVPPCDPNDVTATDACGPVTVTCVRTDNGGSGTPGDPLVITDTFTASDECGNTSSPCSRTITVIDDTPPVVQCPGNITEDNDPGTCGAVVTYTPGVTDNCPGASISCVPPSGSVFPVGTTTVICTATDAAGNTSTCSFDVTVNDTEPPTIGCANITTDNDPGLCSAVVSFSPQVSDNCPGQLTVVCSPSSGSAFPVGVTTVTCTVTDPGGSQSTCSFTVTVTDVEPPVIISCPPAITVATFDDLPPCDGSDVQATDNCGFTVECIPCAAGGVGCTDNPITSSYVYIVTDAAGNADTCTRVVIIAAPGCPTMAIAIGGGQETTIVPVGSQVSIPIQLNTNELDIGSFDLLLGYDRAVMSLIAAERGTAVAAWEYFSYRLGSDEDCTDDCPSGTIRLMGVADLSNGSAPPAEAYALDGVIANLTFEVSTDQDLAGLETAVSQYTRDCLSNVIRNRDGDVSYTVVDLATDPCLAEFSGKAVISSVTIEAGLIRISGPGDGRGDLNLNGMAYEVGDAVLLSSYFMHGDGVFSDDPAMRAQQILASDINNDGVVLSVGDLVYLIRVLTGEAAPAGQLKRSPYAATGNITYRVENGAMTVSTTSSVDLGGALFVFRYSGVSVGTPVLAAAASDLRLTSRASNGELRVLISTDARSVSAARVAAGTNHLFTVPVDGEGRLELVESQLSDAEGSLMSVLTAHASIPTGFSLLQNYPNPFNAGTVIPFELGREGDWMVQVYNVAGQAIRTFTGHGAAGRYQVSWNGTDESGTAVSSGMYFYRIVSGEFAATRKMVLLK